MFIAPKIQIKPRPNISIQSCLKNWFPSLAAVLIHFILAYKKIAKITINLCNKSPGKGTDLAYDRLELLQIWCERGAKFPMAVRLEGVAKGGRTTILRVHRLQSLTI